MAERCPTCGRAVQVKSSAEGTSYYAPAEVERLREENAVLRILVREARNMIPHADEPNALRNHWCARADAALSGIALPPEER